MAESRTAAVARAVLARRVELGLSVDEAAEKARVHVTSWRRLEDGEALPSPLMIGAVCRVLDWIPATFDHLLHGDLQVDGEGEVVVDLDEWPALRDAPPAIADADVVTTIDVTGLSRQQVAEVEDFVDYLRAENAGEAQDPD